MLTIDCFHWIEDFTCPSLIKEFLGLAELNSTSLFTTNMVLRIFCTFTKILTDACKSCFKTLYWLELRNCNIIVKLELIPRIIKPSKNDSFPMISNKI